MEEMQGKIKYVRIIFTPKRKCVEICIMLNENYTVLQDRGATFFKEILGVSLVDPR